MNKGLLLSGLAATMVFICVAAVLAQSEGSVYVNNGQLLQNGELRPIVEKSNLNPIPRIAASLSETEPNDTSARQIA
jgi:hypothetical protein